MNERMPHAEVAEVAEEGGKECNIFPYPVFFSSATSATSA